MKALSVLVAFCSLFFSVSGHSLESQYFDGDSYQYTCNINYENYREIQAYCKDMSGNWVYNDFDRSGCISPVSNQNGYLTCTQGGGNRYGLPNGSYQASCTNCSANGRSMTCQCKDMRGNYRYTSIYYASCNTPIANTNGQLTCN